MTLQQVDVNHARPLRLFQETVLSKNLEKSAGECSRPEIPYVSCRPLTMPAALASSDYSRYSVAGPPCRRRQLLANIYNEPLGRDTRIF
jgi:hypothetical protein